MLRGVDPSQRFSTYFGPIPYARPRGATSVLPQASYEFRHVRSSCENRPPKRKNPANAGFVTS